MNLTKKIIILFLILIIVSASNLGAIKGIRAEEGAGAGGSLPAGSTESKGAAAGGGSVCAAIPNIFGTAVGTVANPICQAISLALDAVKFAADKAWKASEVIGRSLRDVIAKRIMDYIVDQTVKWIQGGGKPKFITNWNGFLKDVGDIAFDSVTRDLGLAGLCDPFGLQLKLAFMPVPKFSQRVSCTLDKVVKNINNFYIDFSVGGWEGYLASWELQNNFFGAAILTQDEILRKQAKAMQSAGQEAIASRGFLGVKQCKKGTTKDPLANIDPEQLTEVADNCKWSLPSVSEYKSQEEYEKDLQKCATEGSVKRQGFVKDTGGGYCDPNDMVNATPGDIVGKAVGDAISSDKDWAANIQSWTSALVNALINRLMKEGLSEMFGSESAAPSRYYPPEYAGLANQQFQQDKRDAINLINPIKNEWTYLLTKKGNSVVYAREILTTLQQLQANNCTSTTGQLVTAADIANASSTVDSLTAEIAGLRSQINEAETVIDQINSAQTDAEKAAANFAANNFLNTYNTIALQQQIVDGSARAAANQQEADLLKQLEGENILDPNTNQLVNNGLRQRLTECRAPSAGGGTNP